VTDERERARQIHEALARYSPDRKARLVCDKAEPWDVRELNEHLKRLGSSYRGVAVIPENKARKASVTRLNWMLGERRLLIRRDIGEELEWRLGVNTSHQGEPMQGSRLLWEVNSWRYPEPRDGQAQQQDPDDDTADGADAIAALRYLVMSWWKAAEKPEREEKKSWNHDPADLAEAMERHEQRRRYGWRIRRTRKRPSTQILPTARILSDCGRPTGRCARTPCAVPVSRAIGSWGRSGSTRSSARGAERCSRTARTGWAWRPPSTASASSTSDVERAGVSLRKLAV
jgi:hypothetical protein